MKITLRFLLTSTSFFFHQFQITQSPFITLCPSVFHILSILPSLHTSYVMADFSRTYRIFIYLARELYSPVAWCQCRQSAAEGVNSSSVISGVSGEALDSRPVDRVTTPQAFLFLYFYLWFSLLTPTVHSPSNTCSESF